MGIKYYITYNRRSSTWTRWLIVTWNTPINTRYQLSTSGNFPQEDHAMSLSSWFWVRRVNVCRRSLLPWEDILQMILCWSYLLVLRSPNKKGHLKLPFRFSPTTFCLFPYNKTQPAKRLFRVWIRRKPVSQNGLLPKLPQYLGFLELEARSSCHVHF